MIDKLWITPGPWKLIDKRQVGDKNDAIIATVWWTGNKGSKCKAEAEQDAKLVSAAPEMLEALIENMMDWERTVGDENKLEDMRRTLEAIEKATGMSWQEVKEIIEEE
jgi:hypothetical protein